MAEQVLVLGVGNILFSDEAIGVRTVEHLQQCASLPGNVELMDGGTLGIRLMDAIMGCDLLIVVDAVLGGGEAGVGGMVAGVLGVAVGVAREDLALAVDEERGELGIVNVDVAEIGDVDVQLYAAGHALGGDHAELAIDDAEAVVEVIALLLVPHKTGALRVLVA